MAFPADNLNAAVEMYIDGAWTNVVRAGSGATASRILEESGVLLKRGQGGLQDKTTAGSATWTWHDPTGIFNNENPRSPYFGKLVRNTPVRVSVPRSEKALFILNNDDGSFCHTVDKAALDITGDMEVRIDIEPERLTRWASGLGQEFILASKMNETGSQSSWFLRLGDVGTNGSNAKLAFFWSSDGVNFAGGSATTELPVTTGRISIKVTLDVNNGAGGTDVKYYTSTTGINGTYTQLGTTRTFAGIATVKSGTADLYIAGGQDGAANFAIFSDLRNYYGRVYGFQLYNGIGGTKVAEADFTAQTKGATSFSDGLGNTWLLSGSAEITDADYRFYGEYSDPTIEVTRSVAGVGLEVEARANAGGLIRRLTGDTEQNLPSPLSLLMLTYEPLTYIAGEDGSGTATSASNSASGVAPAVISHISLDGFDDGVPGSAGVMTLSTGCKLIAPCKSEEPTTELHFIGVFKFPSIPASTTRLFNIYTTGTVAQWSFFVSATEYLLNGFDSTGLLLVSKHTNFGTGAEPTNWISWHFQINEPTPGVSGITRIVSEWYNVGTTTYFTAEFAGTTSYGGVIGRPVNINLSETGPGLDGVKMAHLLVTNQVGLNFIDGWAIAANAYPGEYPDERFLRITEMMGVQGVVVGARNEGVRLGPQPIDTGMNILYEIPATSGGIISETRDQLALEYRTQSSLYNQFGLELVWADLAEGLQAQPDSTDIANDVIMERSEGGVARATLVDGPMSIQPPPEGISTVGAGPKVNNYLLSELPLLAQAYLTRSSWPSARYPAVKLAMEQSQILASTTKSLMLRKSNITDIITISDMPDMLAPDVLYLLIRGTEEQLNSRGWKINYATVPYGPYRTAELTTGTDTTYKFVAGHHTVAGVVQTQLNTAIASAGATSISVKTLSGPLLATGAQTTGIRINGEKMTITNVTGTTSPQTVTVTRGVEGYTASSHAANSYVTIDPLLKARL